jgi:hypothetical protein
LGDRGVRKPSRWKQFRRSLRPAVVRPLTSLGSFHGVQALVEHAVREVSMDYERALIRTETVDLVYVRPLSLVLEPDRYERMGIYLDALDQAGLAPYPPSAVRLQREDNFTLCLPPVLELHGDTYAVVDGTHRLHLLVRRGDSHATCVVVKGSGLPKLPSELGTWDDVRFATRYVSRVKKFRGLRRRLFRPVGAYLRSDRFQYPSLGAISAACNEAEAAHSGGNIERQRQVHQGASHSTPTP